MNPSGWSDELLVGHKKIDADHKKLVASINRLSALAAGHDRQACNKEFANLIALPWQHFAYEEMFMDVPNDPGANQHKKEHAKLIDELLILKAHFDAGEMDIPGNLQEVLQKWLIIHIVEYDKPLANHLQSNK
ncbi:MAG TPA: bacteriohemerythrin [Rhodocyclaceae bacterium]